MLYIEDLQVKLAGKMLLKDIDLEIKPHEAAVGKVAQEEIYYLMSRGLSEDQATSTIVRGFLNVDIKGLPPNLKTEIDRVIEANDRDSM